MSKLTHAFFHGKNSKNWVPLIIKNWAPLVIKNYPKKTIAQQAIICQIWSPWRGDMPEVLTEKLLANYKLLN
jgi:hypothetical protein